MPTKWTHLQAKTDDAVAAGYHRESAWQRALHAEAKVPFRATEVVGSEVFYSPSDTETLYGDIHKPCLTTATRNEIKEILL